MKRTHKRDELIQSGREIIIKKGFNAASLNDILNAAGVPKGSFYYYFSSKEDFGLAIVDDFSNRYLDRLKRLLEDPDLTPLARLQQYFSAGIADMQACEYAEGCLLGNLAQELSAQNEMFRDRLNQTFTTWEKCLAACITAAQAAGEIAESSDPDELASFILAGWEGAILQAKVAQSVTPMQTFVKVLFQQVLRISVSS